MLFNKNKKKQFQVMINGANFLIETSEGKGKHGFFINCFVEAADAAEAESLAIEEVRSRAKSKVNNDKDDPPKLYAKDIKKIHNHQVEQKQQGFRVVQRKIV